jgi:lipopolysaccharide transport system ATP-binding protein
MTRQEINNKFDEIVAFSEIEKFIDTPVKRYSSGMYIRLAFSVAAHLEPDILLVDEVLAVGDVAFQRKCLGKMSDIAEGGRTVIFVSHNMAAVTRLCERVILLDGGQIVADTDAEAAVSQYLMRADSSEGLRMLDAGNPDVARITAIGTKNSAGDYTSSLKVSEEFCINIQCEIKQEIREAQVAIAVLAIDGTVIFVTAHSDQLSREDAVLKPGTYGFSIQIPAHFLNVGNYALNVRIWGVVSGGVRTSHAAAMQEYNFSIEEVGSIASRMNDRRGGYITPILEWTLEHE